MRRFRQWLRGGLVVLMFAVGLSAVLIVFPLLDLCHTRFAVGVRDRIQMIWYRVLLRVLNVRVRFEGRIADEARLWVSNHVSWLDILLLGSQRPVTFVAKAEVGAWPVVGLMARRTGTLLVQRGDPTSSRRTAEAMAWLLRQNRRVALFPEGTSSPGEDVLRFHARFFQPAVLVGVKVQAIAIAYRGTAKSLAPFVGEDDFLPSLWRLLGEPEIRAEVTYCRPVSAGSLSRDRLAQVTRAQIAEVLHFGAEVRAKRVAERHQL